MTTSTIHQAIVSAVRRRMEHYHVDLNAAKRIVAKDHDISIHYIDRVWQRAAHS